MSAPAKAHEPTMEEILASIRRIIADDDPDAAKAAPEAAADSSAARPELVAPEHRQDDVDAIFAAMDEVPGVRPAADPDMSPDSVAARRPIEMADDLDVLELTEEIDDEPPSAPEPPRAAAHEALRAPRPQIASDRLLSPGVDEAVGKAFGNLAHTVLAGNARTLDDIVREMLRPMLRAWLDDNLPPLVERLVRQEIERVARGGR